MFITVSQNVCRITAVRAGATADNYIKSDTPLPVGTPPATGRWSSSDETPLASEGVKAAERVAKVFQGVKWDETRCSQAARTKKALEIIASEGPKPIIDERLYEMRIGRFEGLEKEQIFEIFKAETGYPSEESRALLPNLWAKRDGELVDGNDCLLDNWKPDEYDNFGDFSKKFIEYISSLAKENLGKNLLVVQHGTPMKAIVAKVWNVPVDRVQCTKGSYYTVEIDKDNNFKLLEIEGVSLEALGKDRRLPHF